MCLFRCRARIKRVRATEHGIVVGTRAVKKKKNAFSAQAHASARWANVVRIRGPSIVAVRSDMPHGRPRTSKGLGRRRPFFRQGIRPCPRRAIHVVFDRTCTRGILTLR
jgi:hypothetical protein